MKKLYKNKHSEKYRFKKFEGKTYLAYLKQGETKFHGLVKKI